MKEIIPAPPPIIRNELQRVQELFQKHVVPSYARFDLAFTHGAGSHVWDVSGRSYLDLGGGIAVCALGHAHPEITAALVEQSQRLVHVSNLYYHEPQGRLAQQLCRGLGSGKVFFCNSGAEANEGLYKLARKFGHDEGRFEVLTMLHSFHGRTLAGIAATGQEKVKKGFEPMTPGFRHVPFNDLPAVRDAISPATAAVLIECVQGEGGITSATPEYLLGLRALCDEHKLLLLMDGVQDGHFRTGRFQAFQRVLEVSSGGAPASAPPASGQPKEYGSFLPDGMSMAKSLGGGFPIGAFWVREQYADLLGPGTHATTFGGTPLGCAVALRILEIIERDRLAENARHTGAFLKDGLQCLVDAHPRTLRAARGLGFMLGLELAEKEQIPAFVHSDKPASVQFVNRLHEAGVLTIPSGNQVVRLLPPLNLTRAQAEHGLNLISGVVRSLG